jgi:hypothetical protein
MTARIIPFTALLLVAASLLPAIPTATIATLASAPGAKLRDGTVGGRANLWRRVEFFSHILHTVGTAWSRRLAAVYGSEAVAPERGVDVFRATQPVRPAIRSAE